MVFTSILEQRKISDQPALSYLVMRSKLGEKPAEIPLLNLAELAEKFIEHFNQRLRLGARHDFQLPDFTAAAAGKLDGIFNGGIVLDPQRTADIQDAVRAAGLNLKRLEAPDDRCKRIENILASFFRRDE